MTLPKPFKPIATGLAPFARIEPVKIDTSFVTSLVEIGKAFATIQKSWTRTGQILSERFAETFREGRRADAVLRAGWVPHPTTPLAEIEEETAPVEIGRILAAHYSEHWAEARATFSASVQASGVDAEAVATFEEALAAHEAGLYRSVVRVLFPEIERIARETVYGGSRREAPVAGRQVGKLNSGLRDLREALMSEVPVGLVLDTPFALSLVEKLYEHLYEYVPENEAGLAVFARDPVPNRHASQHGYVAYATAQHSLNMLAMADFLFNIILRVKGYMDEQGAADTAGEEAAGEGSSVQKGQAE